MLNKISEFIVLRFPFFIAGYFLLQIFVRLITTPGLVFDESEQMMLTQYLAIGYNAQPPLYTWMQKLFFVIFGENVFAMAVLKNLLLFSIYIFTYNTARLISDDKKKAALSAFSLLFIPQLMWEAQIDQIHTILLTASTAATVYFYFYTLKNKTLKGFVFLGLAAACGMLAKYNFVIVVFALLCATLLIKEYRQTLLRKELAISIALSAVLILPHYLWVINNMQLATSETLGRMSMDQQGSYLIDVLHGSLELVSSYVLFVLVFLIFFFSLFGKNLQKHTRNESKALLIYIGATFVSILIIVFVTQTTNIKERWLQPYLYLLPMLFFLFVDLACVSSKKHNIFIATGLSFCVIVSLLIPLRIMSVDLGSKPHRENYPFQALSEKLSEAGFSKGVILSEDKFTGGNLKLLFHDSTVITPSIPLQKYSLEEPVLVVWQRNNPTPYIQDATLIEASEVVRLEVPYRYSEKFTCTYFYQLLKFAAN